MEKISIVISVMFHDSSFSMLVSCVVGFVVGFWHTFYPFRMRELKEKELVQISPSYQGINSQVVLFMLLWLGSTYGLLFLVRADDWSLSAYGVQFYPSIEILFAAYGVFQALFALWKGVYPQAKSLSYVYGDEKKIRRIAIVQIVIAIVVSVLSVVVFNILGAYYKME